MPLISRRGFLGQALAAGAAVGSGTGRTPTASATERPTTDDISLAAWSLVASIHQGKIATLDLPRICREDFNINGLELVNTLFEVPTQRYLERLKREASQHGVRLVLIMVDDEGAMYAADRQERLQAAVYHRKWVDIAHTLGCHAIRCNLRGPDGTTVEEAVRRATESFQALLTYAKPAGISVLIENHGGLSSTPEALASLMQAVNDPDFGTLPDFGNFPPETDRTDAVRKLLPWAKGMSIKTRYVQSGEEAPGYDVVAMLRMVHDGGYRGFYGIESGSGVREGWWDEWEAVRKLQRVIRRVILGRG